MAPPAAAARERIMVRVDPHNVVVVDQRTSRGTSLILTLLALAVLLLLIGVAAWAGGLWNPLQLAVPASTATANATLSATAAPASSSTASSGTPAVATATSLATVTATAGGQPALSVTPTQSSQLVCLGPLGASVQFQVLNSGGGSLDWTASASPSSYQVTPASGSLAHNQQQTVTVSNILLPGSVTFKAPGAQNSPQTVTISCTV